MLKKVIVAALSTIILSIFISAWFYVPVSHRQTNVAYFSDSFWSLIPLFMIFTAPSYFLGGIPVSILIDKYVESKVYQFILYILAGLIIGILVSIVYFLSVSNSFSQFFSHPSLSIIFGFGLYGAGGSFLFFFTNLLVKLIGR